MRESRTQALAAVDEMPTAAFIISRFRYAHAIMDQY